MRYTYATQTVNRNEQKGKHRELQTVLFPSLRQLPHPWRKADALCGMASVDKQTGKKLKGKNKMEKLTMRATLPEIGLSNAVNHGGDKETISRYCVVGKINGKLAVIAEARMHMGRSASASTVYCALWVHGDAYTSGRGKAGGGGYHKESAALQDAIDSAGITLHGSTYSHCDKKPDFKNPVSIAGCGTDAMHTALKAIARAAGAKGELLIC